MPAFASALEIYREPDGNIPHVLIGIAAELVLVAVVILKQALHLMDVASFGLYGKPCHAGKIMRMVHIRRHSVEGVKVKGVKTYCLPEISEYNMPVDAARTGLKFVFVQMRVHSYLRQQVNYYY